MAHAGDFRRVTVECSKPAGREASIAWRVPTLAFSPAGSRGPVVEAQAEEAHLCASLNNRECLAYLLLPRPHWVLSLKKSSKTEKRPAGGGGTCWDTLPCVQEQDIGEWRRHLAWEDAAGSCTPPGGCAEGQCGWGPYRPEPGPAHHRVARAHPLGGPLGPVLAVSVSQTVRSPPPLWHSRAKRALLRLSMTVFIHVSTC